MLEVDEDDIVVLDAVTLIVKVELDDVDIIVL